MFCIVADFRKMINLKESVNNGNILVVAHRGSSGTAPENTLAAYKEAIDAGAKMIEIDVQITKDNHIVAYHDYYPAGLDKKISELDYDDIKDIDIGSGFDEKFADEKIPLLEEVIKLAKDKCYLMLEIKTITGEKFSQSCNLLLDLIYQYNYEKNTIFGSFNYAALALIKKINPELYTAAIKIPGDKSLPSEIQKVTGCVSFICSVEEFNNEISENAKANDIITGVYSVETKYQLEKVLDLGCKAIATNYPRKIMKLLEEIKSQRAL